MKICLVATFPPSGRQLNEYAFHIARELQRHPGVELTILADELTQYDFATDGNGQSIDGGQQQELPGFNVIRCWGFNSLTTPLRLAHTIRRLKPDVVWFNLPSPHSPAYRRPPSSDRWASSRTSPCTISSSTSTLPLPAFATAGCFSLAAMPQPALSSKPIPFPCCSLPISAP